MNLSYYLALDYHYTIITDFDDGGFVIMFPDLPGCMTQCEETSEIAVAADEIKRMWLTAQYNMNARWIPYPNFIPIPAYRLVLVPNGGPSDVRYECIVYAPSEEFVLDTLTALLNYAEIDPMSLIVVEQEPFTP